MKAMEQGKLEGFLEAAGLDEEPLGSTAGLGENPDSGFRSV